MIDMLKSHPDDERPATMADVRRAYRRNFTRFLILLALFLVLGGSFAAYTRQQQAEQDDRARLQCEQRRASLTKANAFYQRMADLEQSNHFIDDKLRAQRVDLYRGLVYPLPTCS